MAVDFDKVMSNILGGTQKINSAMLDMQTIMRKWPKLLKAGDTATVVKGVSRVTSAVSKLRKVMKATR